MRKPLTLVASVAAIAVWLDFSRFQAGHHADSLVPVLTGLTTWTPFFWGQDRYGMLIPLLALPVRDPEAHLLLQGFLTVAVSAWGLILLVRGLLPPSVPWVPAAALLFVLLLLNPAQGVRFDILWAQPYMLSLGLGVSGAALVHRGGPARIAGAGILFLAAAWVNLSVAVVVAPLVLWRAFFTDAGRFGLPRFRFVIISFLFLVLSTFASVRWSSAVSLPHTPTELVSKAGWLLAARALVLTTYADENVRLWMRVSFALAAVGLLSLGAASVRRAARANLGAACGLLVTAAFPLAVAAASRWVAQNGYPVRYAIPSLVLLEVACCLLATLPALAVPGDRQDILRGLSVGAVAVALLLAVGPPSRYAVEQAFDSRWGTTARNVIASRATHVTGDYWKVWPTVFYTSWLLGTPNRPHWPYGITDRSVATLAQARAVVRPRVAVLDGKVMWLGILGPREWLVAERRSDLILLTLP